MARLSGKVAWVTGAGTGIGAAAAEALAREGAKVVLTGRRREKLEEVAARIGAAAQVMPADLTVAAEVRQAADAIVGQHGRLDILVNNAGTNIVERDWKRLKPEGVDTLIHGNLSSAFYCTTAVLPQMRAQGGGLIIHTSSMAGRFVSPLSGPGYTAAKHGVVAMSHSINQQECVNNIRSCCICPGEVNTEILQKRPVKLTEEELAKMVQPEDVGELVAFIATRPAHVCLNEILITPTWNRGYVAQMNRGM
ncbi:MAG: SDR family oxidoreductase [Acetobacteraceae bacterium]|nr:SDR family oxidoreductase [Acetobacteraceae bacterium]